MHQRHADRLVVEVRAVRQAAVLQELLAVVGGDDDDGRVAHAGRVERRRGAPRSAASQARDLAVVERAQVRELRRARAARRRAS